MLKKTPVEKLSLIERTKAAAVERNVARLEELVELIRRKMNSAVECFYDMGEALREIVDKKLYAAAGHANLDALLDAEGLMSRRQAGKLIAVARKVPRTHALGLGHERAYALVAYTEATSDYDSVATLVESAATIGGKAVAEVSVREIEAATREARTQATRRRPKTDAEREQERVDEALIRSVRDAMRAVGAARPTVQVVGDEVRIVLSRAQAERLSG